MHPGFRSKTIKKEGEMSFIGWLGALAVLCFFGIVFLLVWLLGYALVKCHFETLYIQMKEEGLPEEEIEKRLKEAEMIMLAGQNLGGF